jgi:hypothetical protein
MNLLFVYSKMIGCFPIVKYIFIVVLFIFSFICWYKPELEIVGFSSVFVVQTLFTSILFLDIMNDSGRINKTLKFATLQSMFAKETTPHEIPLYWILVTGSFLQFVSSFIMMITTSSLYKKFQKIKLSSDSEFYSNLYKILYITTTVMMMLLLYVYINITPSFPPLLMILLAIFIIGIVVISAFNVFISSKLSTYIQSSVDG